MVRIAPDNETAVLSDLITWYGSAGRWREAQQLLSRMESQDLNPSKEVYDRAVWACAVSGKLKQTLSMLTEMKRVGVTPSLHTYHLAIPAFDFKEEWRGAVHLLRVMRAEGVEPTVDTYHTVLKVPTRTPVISFSAHFHQCYPWSLVF